jgi:hypothetical protein
MPRAACCVPRARAASMVVLRGATPLAPQRPREVAVARRHGREGPRHVRVELGALAGDAAPRPDRINRLRPRRQRHASARRRRDEQMRERAELRVVGARDQSARGMPAHGPHVVGEHVAELARDLVAHAAFGSRPRRREPYAPLAVAEALLHDARGEDRMLAGARDRRQRGDANAGRPDDAAVLGDRPHVVGPRRHVPLHRAEAGPQLRGPRGSDGIQEELGLPAC